MGPSSNHPFSPVSLATLPAGDGEGLGDDGSEANEELPPQSDIAPLLPSLIFATHYPAPRLFIAGKEPSSRIVEIDVRWHGHNTATHILHEDTVVTDISLASKADAAEILVRSRTSYQAADALTFATVDLTSMAFHEKGPSRTADVTRTQPADLSDLVMQASDLSSLQPGATLIDQTVGPLEQAQIEQWSQTGGPSVLPRTTVDLTHDPRLPASFLQAAIDNPRTRIPHVEQAYENGMMRFARVETMITKWLGPKGTMDRLRVQIQAPTYVGDHTRIVCTVAQISRRAEVMYLSLSLRGINQHGVLTTSAVAEITAYEIAKASADHQDLPAEDPLASFLAIARQTPEKIAIRHQHGSTTYGQLLAAAEQAAVRLLASGVAPDDIVGICLTRSTALVVHLHAVLLTGAAYLVLDPQYPQDRLVKMARPCKLILCEDSTSEIAQRLDKDCIRLSSLASTAATPFPMELSPVSGSRLAYVMWTSGSTQTPRAAEITRHALNAAIREMAALGYRGADVCLHTASFSFSASVRQIFVPLSLGATVVLADAHAVRDPSRLLQLCKEHRVTLWDSTPSGLNLMLAYHEHQTRETFDGIDLRTILLTGEPLHTSTAIAIRRWMPSVSIVNLYSQTETSGTVSAYVLPHELPLGNSIVPSGRPLSQCQIAVLDPRTRSPLQHTEGEIYVRSSRLAKSYRDDPEQTRAHFVEDLPSLAGRWYKTGDRGYFDATWQLVVSGRADHVVNVKGVRISLAEMEASIAAHSSVAEALVLPILQESGTSFLSAVVTLKQKGSDLTPELRADIYRGLPAPMQPRHLIALPTLPRLPNLKVDRSAVAKLLHAALPRQETPRSKGPDNLTELERQLLELIVEEAGNAIGIDEPIAYAGLDSLATVRLAAAMEQQFDRRLPLTSIYEADTVRHLARLLRDYEPEHAVTIPLKPQRNTLQNPLFYLAGINGHPYDFLGIARRMTSGRRIYGLQYPREPMSSIEDLAAHFKHHILQIQPTGHYLIAGHSLGGRVAFEIAKQLSDDNGRTALPIFVDASAPVYGLPSTTRRLMRRGLHYMGRLFSARRRGDLMELVRRRLWLVRGHPPTDRYLVSPSHLRLMAGLRADRVYRPAPFAGEAVLLKAEILPSRERGLLNKGPVLGWRGLVRGNIKVLPIPGDHSTCVTEAAHMQVLAERLDEVLQGL